ncbi:hypothetical protein MTR67_051635 [Solanum verrucosum]|uniref:Uncharacterized protein n=1 Tax=Solanum verrucosum TaxID=315347 RepID=A0AAF1A2L7_SOLVR|nr:hypothetical protein MTR67_051635 [Solanum verrucosum]
MAIQKLWEADIEIKKENILNSESSGTKVDGLLKICLVSHFGREDEEKPFLADLRSGHIPTGKQLLGFLLEWRRSIAGCTPTTQRAIGVPLTWSNHKIGEKCGGMDCYRGGDLTEKSPQMGGP